MNTLTIKKLCTLLYKETSLQVINIVKVRLLQDIVQNITAISKKIDWRNFYNPVQVSLNANTDAKMTL